MRLPFWQHGLVRLWAVATAIWAGISALLILQAFVTPFLPTQWVDARIEVVPHRVPREQFYELARSPGSDVIHAVDLASRQVWVMGTEGRELPDVTMVAILNMVQTQAVQEERVKVAGLWLAVVILPSGLLLGLGAAAAWVASGSGWRREGQAVE